MMFLLIIFFIFVSYPTDAITAETKAKPSVKRGVAPSAVVSCIPTYSLGCVVTLSWIDMSNNEDGFRIYGKLNAGQYTISTTVPANSKSWVSSNLVQSDTPNNYCWQVSAYNSAGESARTPELCYTVPAAPPPVTIPAAPTGATLQ